MVVARMVAEAEIPELTLHVASGIECLAGRPEVRDHMIDAGEATAIDVVKAGPQIDARPGSMASLVRVVQDKPVGVELFRDVFDAAEYLPPFIGRDRAVGGKPFHADEAASAEPAGPCECVVGRPIVDQVDLDALAGQILQRVRDEIGLVVGGKKRYDAEILSRRAERGDALPCDYRYQLPPGVPQVRSRRPARERRLHSPACERVPEFPGVRNRRGGSHTTSPAGALSTAETKGSEGRAQTERERPAQILGRMVLLRRQIDDVRTAERLGKVISELTDKVRERSVDQRGRSSAPVGSNALLELISNCRQSVFRRDRLTCSPETDLALRWCGARTKAGDNKRARRKSGPHQRVRGRVNGLG